MAKEYEYHTPVLLSESVEGLRIKPEGIYVDATFGGGGHSREILKRLKKGRLLAFDQDEDAAQIAKNINESSFTFCFSNFRYIKRYLRLHQIDKIDGILADLGISSHQIDTPERGFSTRYESELDMRMDQKSDLTAAKILNDYSQKDLHRILGMYGEVRNAKTLAMEIIQKRHNHPFKNTMDLTSLLENLAKGKKIAKYKAQVFQALRIEVNQELEVLKEFLQSLEHIVNPGGKISIISYHSLEDRLVKNLFKTGNTDGKVNKDMYGNLIRPFEPDHNKPIEPEITEIERNKRARSAKLRIATKK